MTKQLLELGWSQEFEAQRRSFENAQDPKTSVKLTPYRLTDIHRSRMNALGETGAQALTSPRIAAGELAVGDWVLADPELRIQHFLERKSLLQRRGAGTDVHVQLIAANVDVLFIVTSCNEDFNIARIERFLALAHESGCYPVLVLSKADLCEDVDSYTNQAQELDASLTIVAVNARDQVASGEIAQWCKAFQTAAFIGSSGVGKTTLTNALTGGTADTGGVREADAKGRHITTSRSMRPRLNGGWIIDMPGMRALRLLDTRDGIDSVFDDLSDLEAQCKFSDCAHETEPGCAIRKAVEEGDLDLDRLERWRKLRKGEAKNTMKLSQTRARTRNNSKAALRSAGKRKARS
jgi:ribosome biogenesis GTPase